MLGRSKPATISPSSGMPSCAEDVGPGARIGGRGQRQPRNVAMLVEQGAQLAIVGAEVVAPFADAMRLVDGDQRQVRAIDQPAEAVGRSRAPERRRAGRARRRGSRSIVCLAVCRRPRSARPRGCRSPRPSGSGRASARSAARSPAPSRRATTRRQLVAERLARARSASPRACAAPPSPGSTTCSCTPRKWSKPKTVLRIVLDAAHGRHALMAASGSCRSYSAASAASSSTRSAACRYHRSA